MPCQVPACNFSIEPKIDMAVFISPQYKDDADILDAIYTYIDAVYDDIGWNIGIVFVDDSWNRYDMIDIEIKKLCDENPIKACLMVGEDMSENLNVFVTSIDRKCHQSIVPWCTHYAYSTVTSCPAQVVLSLIKVNIPTSLLYPNFNDSYETKRSQLISVFNKFSSNRNKDYTNDVLAFCDDSKSIRVVDILENELPTIGDTDITINPSQDTIDASVDGEYALFVAAGHANPLGVVVTPNSPHMAAVDITHIKNINCPLIILYGCGTNYWWTDVEDDCLYQLPSNRLEWFGHTIFDNSNIRAMVTGFPIGGYKEKYPPGTGFVINSLKKMSEGKTIAESMTDMWSYGSNDTLFGDPTFHY